MRTSPGDPAASWATRSQVFGLVALPLWLASFSWVPFAMNDEDLLAIVAIVLGRRAERHRPHTRLVTQS